MAVLNELVAYCDQLLEGERFRDYCPNGLQVQGGAEVTRLVSGVTASQALIDAAIERGADAILVHHGWFWKGEDARVIGIKQRRLKSLLANDISLIAYHLPLDAHPELGNNAGLGVDLGLIVEAGFGGEGEPDIALRGRLPEPLSPAALGARIEARLGRAPLHIAGAGERVETVAWCTGAAQSYIDRAVAEGVDAFISGEISEQTVHVARESGLHFYSAGHHATERYGARALGEHLAERFGIAHEFVDIDNPV